VTADVVARIDETLTYYSAGLGADLSVPVETPQAWVDMAAHTPDRSPLLDGRVNYLDLTEAEREAVHAWVRLHGIEPEVVPVDGAISHDRVTHEWVIECFALRDGRPYWDGANVVRETVRRPWFAPLPWRRAQSWSITLALTPQQQLAAAAIAKQLERDYRHYRIPASTPTRHLHVVYSRRLRARRRRA
jgi:hypothetical protein